MSIRLDAALRSSLVIVGLNRGPPISAASMWQICPIKIPPQFIISAVQFGNAHRFPDLRNNSRRVFLVGVSRLGSSCMVLTFMFQIEPVQIGPIGEPQSSVVAPRCVNRWSIACGERRTRWLLPRNCNAFAELGRTVSEWRRREDSRMALSRRNGVFVFRRCVSEYAR